MHKAGQSRRAFRSFSAYRKGSRSERFFYKNNQGGVPFEITEGGKEENKREIQQEG